MKNIMISPGSNLPVNAPRKDCENRGGKGKKKDPGNKVPELGTTPPEGHPKPYIEVIGHLQTTRSIKKNKGKVMGREKEF